MSYYKPKRVNFRQTESSKITLLKITVFNVSPALLLNCYKTRSWLFLIFSLQAEEGRSGETNDDQQTRLIPHFFRLVLFSAAFIKLFFFTTIWWLKLKTRLCVQSSSTQIILFVQFIYYCAVFSWLKTLIRVGSFKIKKYIFVLSIRSRHKLKNPENFNPSCFYKCNI